MITIIDDKGLLHLIPRERLVSISMYEATPGVDPEGTKIKLIFLYDLGTQNLGQLVFFFHDLEAISSIKNVLLNWATLDETNQLVINAGPSPAPPAPETAAIAI